MRIFFINFSVILAGELVKAFHLVYTEFVEKRILNYRIIIEKEKYGDGSIVYVAYCPTLGISDYGGTIEDVLTSINDGIELAVESLAKEGKEVPVDHMDEQIITSAKISIPPNLKISLS